MSQSDLKVQRVERALQAAYFERGRDATAPAETSVQFILTRVRACALGQTRDAPGETQFLWRFLSAGAVAAAVLVAVALTNLPGENLTTLNPPTDDMVAMVLNPTMPF
jgi:hypothetical protein